MTDAGMTFAGRERFTHLVDLLRWRGEAHPERDAVIYLQDGETDEARLSYAALDQRARAVAAWLQSEASAGERVLLLFPPGLNYIEAYFGCLYAGMIAVPAYPPRLNQTNERLQMIVQDCDARFVLTDRDILQKIEKRFEHMPILRALRWQAVDDIQTEAALWRRPDLRAEDIAFLQYTSGSTAAPKGVMVTHDNLMQNEAMIRRGFGHADENFTVVSWLPIYHDMGLIGNVLQPLYMGARTVIMSPTAFLQRPVRWLKAITRYSGNSSGGPNFGFDQCVEKITPAEREGLDLSSWTVAYNGSEPVRAATVRAFTEAFADCGFDPGAFYPCYGLAEATLFVSGGPRGVPPRMIDADAAELERNRLRPATEADNTRTLVSSGPVWDQVARIVNPETGAPCGEDEIGEIWLQGDNIALGYWNKPELNDATFQATLPDGTGPYFRTGDLGLLKDGELYVTGRIKELIIIRGRNHYPHDIELTVEQAHEALRPGCGAAFSVDMGGEEQLVIVQELRRQHRRKFDADAIFAAIREAVSREHQLMPGAIVLINTLSLMKTSSGKIQRRGNRQAYLDGTLDVLAAWEPEALTPRPASDEALTPRSPLPKGEGAFSPHPPAPSPQGEGEPEALTPRPASDEALTPQPPLPNATLGEGEQKPTRRSASRGIGNALYPLMGQGARTADELLAWLREYAETRLNSRVMDERRTLAPHVVLDMGNRGLLGMQVPDSYGGLGLSYQAMLAIIQQLGAIDQTLALFVGLTNILGIRPVMHYAADDLREALLPAMASGRELAAFALTEPGAGSNPRAIQARAVPVEGGLLLTGQKIWSGTAAWSSLLNVFVQEFNAEGQPLGVSAFTVRQGAPGLRQGPEAMTMGMRGMIQNTVYLDEVFVTEAQRLGAPGGGMDVAQDAMMMGRLAIAAASVGGMKRSAQLMLRYAERRKVSTGSLLQNPVTRVRLSEITLAAHALESLLELAAGALDAGQAVPVEVYTACKIAGPEWLWRSVDDLMQMLGGRGYIESNGVPQMLRDARILRVFEGPTEALRMFLGGRSASQPGELLAFVADVLQAPDIGERMVQAVTRLREWQMARQGEHDADAFNRQQWADYLAGEIVTYGLLQAASEQRFVQTRGQRFKRAMLWAEAEFERRVAQALNDPLNPVKPFSADELRTLVGDFAASIGDVQPSMAGEDHALDGWLRREEALSPHSPAPSAQGRGGDGSGPHPPAPAPQGEGEISPHPSASSPQGRGGDVQGGGRYSEASIRGWMVDWVVNNLRLPRRSVDVNRSFADYGMDSVRAVEFAQALETWLEERVSIDEVVTWNYPTIAALAQYLATHPALNGDVAPEAPVTSEAEAEQGADLDDLSADEVAHLLAAELRAINGDEEG